LHDIVKKDQKWKWTKKQKKTFRKLKDRFTKKLVLVILDLDKKIRMKVNTSNYAIKCYDLKSLELDKRTKLLY